MGAGDKDFFQNWGGAERCEAALQALPHGEIVRTTHLKLQDQSGKSEEVIIAALPGVRINSREYESVRSSQKFKAFPKVRESFGDASRVFDFDARNPQSDEGEAHRDSVVFVSLNGGGAKLSCGVDR